MGPGNGGRSVPQDRGGTPILGRTNSRGQPRPSPGPELHMNPGASEPGVKSGRLVAKILGSYFRKTPPSRPANMNPPVNFTHPSTGENGDSEAEFVASKVNPAGLCW